MPATKTKTRKGQCVSCGGLAPLLCDYEVAPGKTCDAGICRGCAESAPRYPAMTGGFVCIRGGKGSGCYPISGMTVDHCPEHAIAMLLS